MRGGVRQDASAMETLKQADYQTIKDECNYISAISPTVNSSGQWINGNNNTQSSIYGVNQDYLSIRQLKVADGEMFTDNDIKAAAKVCILGQTVVDYLFPDGSDPVGKVVRFNSIPFRVVGVLKKKGYNSMGMDQDDLVLAPIHHRDEAHPGTDLSGRYRMLGHYRGSFAAGSGSDFGNPAPQPQAEGCHRYHRGR